MIKLTLNHTNLLLKLTRATHITFSVYRLNVLQELKDLGLIVFNSKDLKKLGGSKVEVTAHITGKGLQLTHDLEDFLHSYSFTEES